MCNFFQKWLYYMYVMYIVLEKDKGLVKQVEIVFTVGLYYDYMLSMFIPKLNNIILNTVHFI